MPLPRVVPGSYPYHPLTDAQSRPYTANSSVPRSGGSQPPPPIPRKVPSSNHLNTPESHESRPVNHVRSVSQPAELPRATTPTPSPPVLATPVSPSPRTPPVVSESRTEPSPWTCDACMDEIPTSKPRIHCLECPDYDLCNTCYRNDRTSKTHQSNHRIRRVLRTHVLPVDDMEFASGPSDPNWTMEENYRWLHLGERNSHARFLATNIKPGHYSVSIILCSKISPKLTPTLIDQLNDGVLGKLRITVGFPISRKVFVHGEYPEDDLPKKLFTQKTQKQLNLLASEGGNENIMLSAVFHVPGGDQTRSQIGFVLQWSDIISFAHSDSAIVQIALIEAR
jgi:hypothetical protein